MLTALHAAALNACSQSMKFPQEFNTKVDLTKVSWDVMKPWIAKRITELLGGFEDDVLIGYAYEQLEGKKVGGWTAAQLAVRLEAGWTAAKGCCRVGTSAPRTSRLHPAS